MIIPIQEIRIKYPEIDYFRPANNYHEKHIFGVTEYGIFPYQYDRQLKELGVDFTSQLKYVTLKEAQNHAKQIIDFIIDKTTPKELKWEKCIKCR